MTASRRDLLGLGALGISTLTLPSAAAAVSPIEGTGGDWYMEAAQFYFTAVSGSQFGFTWVRDATEGPFDYTVTVEVVDSSAAVTQPTVTTYEWGPYPSGAFGSGEFGVRQVVTFDPLYGGSTPLYASVAGTRFRAIFESVQTRSQVRTVPVRSQDGDDVW